MTYTIVGDMKVIYKEINANARKIDSFYDNIIVQDLGYYQCYHF